MAMVTLRATEETINFQRPKAVEASPSKPVSSDEASEPSSPTSANVSVSAGTPDRSDLSNSSPNPNRDVESQSPEILRSEEYRQLFRLPLEELLLQDFNCAYQESILLQGHMYLFVHYICFYSNIFGFETKKIIPFLEVTSVKRAKTAGIFPNAIEIFAGGKKYFFASFISRDEAFKIIHDGWSQCCDGAKAALEQQISISESSSQDNGNLIERVASLTNPVIELDSTVRDEDPPIIVDSELPGSPQNDVLPTQVIVEEHVEPVAITESSSSAKNCTWKLEDLDAPKISEYYAKVGETKFPITVEDFFNLFLSDDALPFLESFHRKCGDKEFKCTSWNPDDKFGHTRDVSFQHPIKFYLGAKCGSCFGAQKFRVFRNSHLVFETSQVINDVPYGDYFRVEGLWDVQRDTSGSKEGCILNIYINVAFSKRTVWKGKIVQTTQDECKDVYAAWIDLAHELLKQKNLEKKEVDPATIIIHNNEDPCDHEARTAAPSERLQTSLEQTGLLQISDPTDLSVRIGNLLQGSLKTVMSILSLLKDASLKSCSSLKSQSRMSLVLITAFAVILLMQVTILVLLNKPQQIHMASPASYYTGNRVDGIGYGTSEATAWIEKRLHHLKDEMFMVEGRLERMWHEHAVLKAHLNDLEQLRKPK